MPNNQAHDTRTTDPLQRAVQAVMLSVTSRPGSISSTDWLSHSQTSRAPAPILRFTDLISGPATGLGDGLGDGVIVTVWAQGIGDSQGTSKIYFTDSLGTKREAAHVYYWKRADGQLPSGPARLWYSHLMQEVAFSIPAGSADGLGTITIEKDGMVSVSVDPYGTVSVGLPFTVRAGNIYHIKSTGTDGSAGTFNDPWLTTEGALHSQTGTNLAPAGSTIYIHDVDTGSAESPKDQSLYWNNGNALSGKTNQFSTVAYPGTRPAVYGQRAVSGFNTEGWVVSKIDIYASNYAAVDANDQPIDSVFGANITFGLMVSKNGRAVANRITDLPGGCASGRDGAINGVGGQRVGDNKLFGNEVYDYGCAGTDKLHHTTYLTIRDDADPTVEAWEWGWNFLHGNHAKFGIHNYDQLGSSDNPQGDIAGDLLTHDNVIVEQGGAGISNGSASGWTCDSYITNNLLIQVGNAHDWDGVDPLTTIDDGGGGGISLYDTGAGYLGTIYCRDNMIYRYSEDGATATPGGLMMRGSGAGEGSYVWDRNITYTAIDLPFEGYAYQAEPKLAKVTGSSNAWFTPVQSPSRALVPSFDTSPVTADPKITLDGAIITLAADSPLKGQGAAVGYDLYGRPRGQSPTIGPLEAE